MPSQQPPRSKTTQPSHRPGCALGAGRWLGVVLSMTWGLVLSPQIVDAQIVPYATQPRVEEVPRPPATPATLPPPAAFSVHPQELPSVVAGQDCPRPSANSVLQGPVTFASGIPNVLPPVQTQPNDRPLPINLATALKLSNARPLVIAVAQARVQLAAAYAEKANVLWLPSAVGGANYIRHDGGNQATNGDFLNTNSNFFIAGGSAELRLSTTDAIYEPLSAKRVLEARRIDTQAARNDALRATAEAYFNVQFARGTYGAMLDATEKSAELVRRVQSLAGGFVAPDEIDRARTQHAALEQATQMALQQWRVASANLTRVLRLDPSAVVMPQEPDHLQVALIDPERCVDDLIVIGLKNRPELAAQQEMVQATLIRLKREKMRPLIPSVLITGNGTPDFLYQGGVFASGSGSSLDGWDGRSDVSAQLVWRLENLGFGNQSRIREQRAENQLATIELFKIQDDVAASVAQAKADVESAAMRVKQAETGLQQGLVTYSANLKGMGQTQRFGDVLSLINRPQEVVAALAQLQTAYINYYSTVADFNRAQFRLFYAMGLPAEELACNRPLGPIEPVSTYRGPALPNVQ
jgi:outer membrane protein TolC